MRSGETLRFVARRFASALLVVWLAVTGTFLMTVVVPADPARAVAGPHASPEALAAVAAELCLDRPLLVRYGCYVGRLARGDLGTSFRTRRPVAELLAERVWPSAQLALGALLLALMVGLPLGMLAALRRDHGVTVVSLVAQSAPPFFVGPLLMLTLAFGLGMFPISGYGEAGLDRVWHLVLPSLTVAAGMGATFARLARAELLDVMGRGFILTARAKGLSRGQALTRHALRNASIPFLSFLGLELGALLGGEVVTEHVFEWPGLGREAILAVQDLDLPVILGVVLVAALAMVTASFLVEVAAALLDPRVRPD